MKSVQTFLTEHKLSSKHIDIPQVVDDFVSEMTEGLGTGESSLRMIPTYIEADNEFLIEVPVVAIDAGGTNFRVANVRFNSSGALEITNLEHAKMPGLKGEISREEFFNEMAGYVKKHVEGCDRIGFCFSYATEIYPNKDGKLIKFSKEVQAPEVEGEMIGANLLKALGTPDKEIVLLNDTVATLLAGKSEAYGKEYDSYIGYILGTGTNTCYIEKNANITKNKDLGSAGSMIINIESGNFSKAPRTAIDVEFDNTTANPGQYTFEKMFSGGYFGGLCLQALKTAAAEGVFTEATASNIESLNQLSAEEANLYVTDGDNRGPLNEIPATPQDHQSCERIINSLIERSASLVAANIAAVILKTEKGKASDKPILITVEGTTFYRMHQLKSEFESQLASFLSGDKKRYYEFTEVKQSSLVGAALAALID
ncbi:MAG: hexokinase [Balneolaceae bacterium]|nr:MAG: hexokinase [Balneolaceae bacterium]